MSYRPSSYRRHSPPPSYDQQGARRDDRQRPRQDQDAEMRLVSPGPTTRENTSLNVTSRWIYAPTLGVVKHEDTCQACTEYCRHTMMAEVEANESFRKAKADQLQFLRTLALVEGGREALPGAGVVRDQGVSARTRIYKNLVRLDMSSNGGTSIRWSRRVSEVGSPTTKNKGIKAEENPSDASILENREVEGGHRTPALSRSSRSSENLSSNQTSDLGGVRRNENSTSSLQTLLDECRQRCSAQNRELNQLQQQLAGSITVQDRFGQRIIELASFALLAYRGNPSQVFPNLYELLDEMFACLYEVTIRVHGEEKGKALESLKSLISRMEVLQSFLRRTEATCRLFVGDEKGRRENERFLLSNIPPQVRIPDFDATLDRTHLPYPEPRRVRSRTSFTPPNTPTDLNLHGTKRSRDEFLEEGEIPSKRQC
ncbi:hypothetical protein K435DRAFT_853583 [Dendrothele bispora CBS 962.96]|uniref:Uncharacterized protein n=1 Tax=Dendrothele bispora (strain CBS 962.96) TaxID=1314807 RepID=A0A4S8MG17_DENBC|nr:hypothetical protein K435DRAFT_853583 [Dendrothele bispora CBS 962.96]